MTSPALAIRRLGLTDYRQALEAMRTFTAVRKPGQTSELWLVEHPPVFTLGQAGKAEHLLNPGRIPVVQSDRGGQVTYHGPGQLVCYMLLNLDEAGIGIRSLVERTEEALIRLLASEDIAATRREGAPGVYTDTAKIAQIGLRVKRHNTYHGLSLNIDMDLEPYARINPCGYEGLAATQLRDCTDRPVSLPEARAALLKRLADLLGYNGIRDHEH